MHKNKENFNFKFISIKLLFILRVFLPFLSLFVVHIICTHVFKLQFSSFWYSTHFSAYTDIKFIYSFLHSWYKYLCCVFAPDSCITDLFSLKFYTHYALFLPITLMWSKLRGRGILWWAGKTSTQKVTLMWLQNWIWQLQK